MSQLGLVSVLSFPLSLSGCVCVCVCTVLYLSTPLPLPTRACVHTEGRIPALCTCVCLSTHTLTPTQIYGSAVSETRVEFHQLMRREGKHF